jgi:ribonuclease HI
MTVTDALTERSGGSANRVRPTTAMTTAPTLHYLLFAEAAESPEGGAWRFVLEDMGTGHTFAATDVEPVDCPERLELLAVVRALEALDHPAKVTLVTKSRYVSRGLKRGLADWRASDWHWERFGRVVPVRDHDLWRRVDRALQFHQLECRLWQFAAPAAVEPVERSTSVEPAPIPTPASTPRARGPLAKAKDRWRRASQAAAAIGEAFRPSNLAAG